MANVNNTNSLIFQKVESNSDLKSLQALINKIFEKTLFNKSGIFFKENEITGKQYQVLDEEKIIGIFVFSTELSQKIPTIDLIGVLPDFQKRKYGSKILNNGLKLIKKFDPSIIEVIVEILADDIQLGNFYIKNGFFMDRIEYYAYNKQGNLLLSGKLKDINNIINNGNISYIMVWNFLKIKV